MREINIKLGEPVTLIITGEGEDDIPLIASGIARIGSYGRGELLVVDLLSVATTAVHKEYMKVKEQLAQLDHEEGYWMAYSPCTCNQPLELGRRATNLCY